MVPLWEVPRSALSRSLSGDDSAAADELGIMQEMFKAEEVAFVAGQGGGFGAYNLTLGPRTEGHRVAKMRVRVCLTVTLPPGYPDTTAIVTMSACRGLSDAGAATVLRRAVEATDAYGAPCVYAVAEAAIEVLSELNDTVECSICFSALEDSDESYTAPCCFHSFHGDCIFVWVWHEDTGATGGAAACEEEDRRLAYAQSQLKHKEQHLETCSNELAVLEAQVERVKSLLAACQEQTQADQYARSIEKLLPARDSLRNKVGRATEKRSAAALEIVAVEAKIRAAREVRQPTVHCPACRNLIPFASLKEGYTDWRARRAAGAGGKGKPAEEVSASTLVSAWDAHTRAYLDRFRAAALDIEDRQTKAGGRVTDTTIVLPPDTVPSPATVTASATPVVSAAGTPAVRGDRG